MAFAARAQNDLSIALPWGAITAPVSGCGLTATENVTVSIFNFGSTLPAGTAFNVSYVINAGAPVTELVVLGSPLTSNSRFTYTFVTQANLSVPGSYTFDATVSLAGDISPANDAFSGYLVTNAASSVGGTVSGTTTVPSGNNSGAVTLTGNIGQVERWELSRDGGTTWLWVSNTTTSQGYLNLTQTTMYRARLKSGACSFAYSSPAAITVSAPLPLGLTGVTAVNMGNRNKIEWSVSDQSDLLSYQVERSADGKIFEGLEVIGAKNKSMIYETYDNSPIRGVNYYRIKMADRDGSYTYSKVVSAIMDGSNAFVINAYPNPASDRVNIDINGAASGTLVLTDIVGAEQTSTVFSGGHTEINIATLPAGVYFLECSNGVSAKTIKLIKY